ncbi:MAG: VOC family protein [Acidobacteriota bacterium]
MENTKAELTRVFSTTLRGLGVSLLALGIALTATLLSAQPTARPADVVGLALVGHHVADLERAIKFYQAIDFKVVEGPTAWAVDKDLNKLGNTPGAESRTAVMQVQSSVSDIPFIFILRQYRGIPRQDWTNVNSWDLGANHIDLTVDGSASDFLDKLEAQKLLKMPEVQGLANPRQQAGFRRYSFIQDPDGLVIENLARAIPKPGDPPVKPGVSDSSATSGNIERLGKQAGFNHYAVNVVDGEKGRDFYANVLGGDFPKFADTGAKAIMQNGWWPQPKTDKNLRIELGLFTINKGKTPSPVKLQDINANYAGIQVSNIETAYARAKANGAITVTQGGIMNYNKGKAVMIRDADVGGYIMLWQPAK